MQIRGIVMRAELVENPPGSDRIELVLWGQGVGPDKPSLDRRSVRAAPARPLARPRADPGSWIPGRDPPGRGGPLGRRRDPLRDGERAAAGVIPCEGARPSTASSRSSSSAICAGDDLPQLGHGLLRARPGLARSDSSRPGHSSRWRSSFGRPSRSSASARSASVHLQSGPPSSAVDRPLPSSLQRPISQSQPAELRFSRATAASGSSPSRRPISTAAICSSSTQLANRAAFTRASCSTIRIASTPLLQAPSAIWRTSSRSTASLGRKSRANSASRRVTSAAAASRQDDPLAGEPVLAAVAPAPFLALRRGGPVRPPPVGPAGLGPGGARSGSRSCRWRCRASRRAWRTSAAPFRVVWE